MVLAWKREAVTAWSRHARDEIAQISLGDGIRSWRARGKAVRDERSDRLLGAALEDARPFAALLLLDSEGYVRASAGAGTCGPPGAPERSKPCAMASSGSRSTRTRTGCGTATSS